MTDKEHIIINGKKQYCKILFRCKHINDLKAYDMICNGIKITPENAPVDDFDLMLIENTDSPFGFSSVCKRNSKENVWEYSGFGHSGACSIVTALLKQLARKTQECEELKEQLQANQPTGICETCMAKAILQNDKYRKTLEEIWGLTQSILDDFETYDTEMQLSYCHDISYQILDIINKAKGEGNEYNG